MYSTLPSQCSICSTLRGNLTKEVLLQFWDYWKHTIWVWFAQEPLSLRDLCQDGEILQLNWNNTISTRRLDYMLWPWFERVASYGSVYQVNRFLRTAFYVSWQIIRLFSLDDKIWCVIIKPKNVFFFSGRARLDLPPGEGADACQVDWGDGERSCSCSICSSNPGGMNTNNLVASMKKRTKWMFFDDDMKEI